MNDAIDPNHYRGVTADGVELQAADVGEAFGLNHHRSTAVEYILRAGKKPGQPAEVDLAKARWWINRDLDRMAAEANGFVRGDDEDGEDGEGDHPTVKPTDLIIQGVRYELLKATVKHPPISSPHEGYAIIAEELEELWAEIRRQKPDPAAMRREATQLAAMAIRFIRDICDS